MPFGIQDHKPVLPILFLSSVLSYSRQHGSSKNDAAIQVKCDCPTGVIISRCPWWSCDHYTNGHKLTSQKMGHTSSVLAQIVLPDGGLIPGYMGAFGEWIKRWDPSPCLPVSFSLSLRWILKMQKLSHVIINSHRKARKAGISIISIKMENPQKQTEILAQWSVFSSLWIIELENLSQKRLTKNWSSWPTRPGFLGGLQGISATWPWLYLNRTPVDHGCLESCWQDLPWLKSKSSPSLLTMLWSGRLSLWWPKPS